MKRFIEISKIEYLHETIRDYAKNFETKNIMREIIKKEIIPIENIKQVCNTEITQLLIYDNYENKLKYIDVKETYNEIKNKMGDMLC